MARHERHEDLAHDDLDAPDSHVELLVLPDTRQVVLHVLENHEDVALVIVRSSSFGVHDLLECDDVRLLLLRESAEELDFPDGSDREPFLLVVHPDFLQRDHFPRFQVPHLVHLPVHALPDLRDLLVVVLPAPRPVRCTHGGQLQHDRRIIVSRRRRHRVPTHSREHAQRASARQPQRPRPAVRSAGSARPKWPRALRIRTQGLNALRRQ
mmetsp:Transcript_8431/g.21735  ORF Transcript_8431/g.21735 Transcript_8431/m.21735 type:complete len:210 (+) Transcript_8431:912-1541(+)